MPSKTPSRRTYALPTIFTVGTLFCGYYCLMKTLQALSLPADQFDEAARLYNFAALAIGLGVFTDGMDGRVARLTGAVSEFGREIDSLADVITFGVAPAMLAVAWGIRTPELNAHPLLANWLPPLGYLVVFLYLTCGAARLARFNVQKNPRPKNPGQPGRRYFVGLPIPPAAGLLAAHRLCSRQKARQATRRKEPNQLRPRIRTRHSRDPYRCHQRRPARACR